jgi:uncharacterized protein (UPF0548 family)
MFSFRRPTDEAIQSFRAAQSQQSLTYAEAGATSGDPPAGWHVNRHRGRLGDGPAAFAAACAAVRAWKMFDLGWIRAVAPGPPGPGVVVAVVGRVWPLWTVNACRVVYVVDEPRRFGFAYGTLPDHAECGEERFLVEWRPDGSVWYDLFSFSRPSHWLARLAGPLGRLMQRRFARDSLAAMQRAVAGVTA